MLLLHLYSITTETKTLEASHLPRHQQEEKSFSQLNTSTSNDQSNSDQSNFDKNIDFDRNRNSDEKRNLNSEIDIKIIHGRAARDKLAELGRFVAQNSKRKVMIAWNLIEYQVSNPNVV